MSNLRAAAQQALKAFRKCVPMDGKHAEVDAVFKSLRAALEQEQEQEPVAWRWRMRNPTDSPGFAQPWNVTTYYPREQANEIEPLYTRPPRREWRGLTEEERRECTASPFVVENYRAIEAALKERNEAIRERPANAHDKVYSEVDLDNAYQKGWDDAMLRRSIGERNNP